MQAVPLQRERGKQADKTDKQAERRPLRLGIAGLGTVGAAVAAALQSGSSGAPSLADKCRRRIELAAVSARSREKALARGVKLDGVKWYDSAADLAAHGGIDVFIELIGGADGAAYDSVKAALSAGRAVITANKALLARHGAELAALAEKQNVPLSFEAAVAGGIPAVKLLREALAGNHISRVYGILNGTCNYVLTRMEAGLPFAAALAEAQKRGYAEADPSFDINGNDTAHKLALLSVLAFGAFGGKTQPVISRCEGIAKISPSDIEAARDLGYRIKLLGIAAQTEAGIEQSVQPIMLRASAPMAQISGETNAIAVESAELGELLLSGPGAGGVATASAVIGDIADIAKTGFAAGENSGEFFAPAVFGSPAAQMADFAAAPEQICRGGYFIRLTVHDRLGVFAAVAQSMAQNGISLKSIVQKEPSGAAAEPGKAVDFERGKAIILITHATKESSVRQALAEVEKTGSLLAAPQYIRIEDAAA